MIRSLFVALSVLAVSAPALATAQIVRTEHVAYADLNLQSAAGAATLHRRIHGAMQRVCEPVATDLLLAHRLRRRCMTETQPSVDAQLAAIGLAPATTVRVLVAAR